MFLMLFLLGFGAMFREFTVSWLQVLLTFTAGLLVQFYFINKHNLSRSSLLSAVISCFGICLLLRAGNLWVHPLAAVMAIGSKFTIRHNDKHLFNPANLGVVIPVWLLPGCWLSSGQWGSDVALAFWFVALGQFGARKVGSLVSTSSFLLVYFGIWYFHRILQLGYELDVMLHQLQSGALLLFAFFMISDPVTTPNHRYAKVIHAVAVAVFAYFWQFYFYFNNAPIWALFILTPLVPVLDHIFKSVRFRYNFTQQKLAGG